MICMYADDVALLGDNEEILISKTDILLNIAKDIELEINITKQDTWLQIERGWMEMGHLTTDQGDLRKWASLNTWEHE